MLFDPKLTGLIGNDSKMLSCGLIFARLYSYILQWELSGNIPTQKECFIPDIKARIGQVTITVMKPEVWSDNIVLTRLGF